MSVYVCSRASALASLIISLVYFFSGFFRLSPFYPSVAAPNRGSQSAECQCREHARRMMDSVLLLLFFPLILFFLSTFRSLFNRFLPSLCFIFFFDLSFYIQPLTFLSFFSSFSFLSFFFSLLLHSLPSLLSPVRWSETRRLRYRTGRENITRSGDASKTENRGISCIRCTVNTHCARTR